MGKKKMLVRLAVTRGISQEAVMGLQLQEQFGMDSISRKILFDSVGAKIPALLSYFNVLYGSPTPLMTVTDSGRS